MRGTKEFHDLQLQFEKDFKTDMFICNNNLERTKKEDNVPSSIFYQDGIVNQLFHAYMMGYQLHKCIS